MTTPNAWSYMGQTCPEATHTDMVSSCWLSYITKEYYWGVKHKFASTCSFFHDLIQVVCTKLPFRNPTERVTEGFIKDCYWNTYHQCHINPCILSSFIRLHVRSIRAIISKLIDVSCCPSVIKGKIITIVMNFDNNR